MSHTLDPALLDQQLKALNPEQLEAVKSTEGRVLVLAGAGSGKTKVLTLRIAYLICKKNISPKAILGLTFTNKAALEMRQRLAALVTKKIADEVNLSTFHSFCMQVLKQEITRLGYTSKFTLYDEKDVERLVKLIARDILEHEGEMPSLGSTLLAINRSNNKGLKVDEIVDDSSKWHEEFTKTVYARLQDSLRAYNAVDFDTLLTLTSKLFSEHGDVLEKYQERYRYLMIDEYQDTNPVQYKLAALLSEKYSNLFVVGDDDQSIYGWRGAEVKNILEFNADTKVKLEQNFRSTTVILEAANAVIGKNTKRHSKKLWSNRGDGDLIEVFFAPSDVEEAEAVAARIALLKEKKNLKWRDVAILYRSNALSRPFELALMKQSYKDEDGAWKRGVPYQVYGGQEFYDRREVKDVFAYLRLLVNPMDQEAILRVINQPRRGIGEKALDRLTAYNRSREISLWQVLHSVADERISKSQELHELASSLDPRALSGIKQFLEGLAHAQKDFSELSLTDAATRLIERVDYKKAIFDEVKSQTMREFKLENVTEFISSIKDFENRFEPTASQKATLHDFVLSTPMQSDWKKSLGKEAEDKVNLMTFHSAKGLEFKACFLVCMEDHIIPHEKSVKETGVEEERRLMYVAITRAISYLTISMSKKRKRNGEELHCQPSRFLHDVPKEYLKAVAWHQV